MCAPGNRGQPRPRPPARWRCDSDPMALAATNDESPCRTAVASHQVTRAASAYSPLRHQDDSDRRAGHTVGTTVRSGRCRVEELHYGVVDGDSLCARLGRVRARGLLCQQLRHRHRHRHHHQERHRHRVAGTDGAVERRPTIGAGPRTFTSRPHIPSADHQRRRWLRGLPRRSNVSTPRCSCCRLTFRSAATGLSPGRFRTKRT